LGGGAWWEVEHAEGGSVGPPLTSASQGVPPGREEARRVAGGSTRPLSMSATRPVAGGFARTAPTSSSRRILGRVVPGRHLLHHTAADELEEEARCGEWCTWPPSTLSGREEQLRYKWASALSPSLPLSTGQRIAGPRRSLRCSFRRMDSTDLGVPVIFLGEGVPYEKHP
jgi:hypothetical protein